MKKLNYNTVSLAVFCAFFCISCSSDKKAQSSEITAPKNTQKIQNVAVVNPLPRSFVDEVLITGTAEPNRSVMLHAMQSGALKGIYKDIGDAVRKGEVIALLENPAFGWQIQPLEVALKSKQIVYDRLKSIREKTPALTTLQQVDDAEAACLLLSSEIATIKEKMTFLQVKAPFSGIITQRFVDEGAMIQNAINNTQAQALFEIQEISPIRLSIPLPETNAPDVKKGMNVTVTFPELPGQTFAAKVSRTSNALDYKSKTMRVEIDLPNRSRTIKPGMYAKAFMQLNIKEEVLSLPVTAQVIKAKKPYLLLVDNANKVQQIALQKGLHDKDYFEVLNTDITKDSKIIIKGKGLVKPAQIVNPVMN